MCKIAFLLPHESMIPRVQSLVAPYEDIGVFLCNLHNTVKTASELIALGYEIIVTRCGIASRIRRAGLPIRIVELQVTAFDVLKALNLAKHHGDNIAVAAYAPLVKGLDEVTKLLNFPLGKYLTVSDDDNEVENLVDRAIRDGANVIVGGGLFCQAANRRGVKSVFIDSGNEAIQQALEEAIHIREVIREEKLKSSTIMAILNHIQDGIITFDLQGRITTINEKARRLLGVDLTDVLDKRVDHFLPGFDLTKALSKIEDSPHIITEIGDAKVFCNFLPIRAEGQIRGVLAVLQDVGGIQKVEARIRRELYNKGHVAKKTFEDIWGDSPLIKNCVELAKKFSLVDSSVLITGETGTGKELFAQAIHNYSNRKNGPFVAINCAALPSDILESELFGYVGGAFTGARKEGKKGLFELAHGGTIFLDEITEMDYKNQSRLLRVLQEKSIMPLGSDRVIHVDVRVIASTNRDIREMVRTHKFRDDLFFRLNVLRLELPPLRARIEDVAVIAEGLLRKYAQQFGKALVFDNRAISVLQHYHWPGNVRELENVIQRLVIICNSSTIRASDVESVLETWDAYPSASSQNEHEIKRIVEALKKANGSKIQAARLLGMHRSTLWRKLKKYNTYVRGFGALMGIRKNLSFPGNISFEK
jgi:transcriptional regulator with PAS, ATPase and Fis domain